MRIIKIAINEGQNLMIPVCACIGYFDGLHKGHQQLIKETVRMAKEKKCETALITFEPDPLTVIRNIDNIQHITTLREKFNFCVKLGINCVIILLFDKEMSKLSPEEFIVFLNNRVNLRGLVCGFDFHYGHMGKGSPDSLKEASLCEVRVIPPVEDKGGKISSSRIGAAVKEGDMASAEAMLGYPFGIEGQVIDGSHAGISMGYPTANISFNPEYILPKEGVYAGYCILSGQIYKAMINLGYNPTFNPKKFLSLEAHLIDFKGNLYQKRIRVIFKKYIRPEIKFRSKFNLIMQLDRDKKKIMEILDDHQ